MSIRRLYDRGLIDVETTSCVYWEKVKDYDVVATGLSYADDVKTNYLEKRDRYYLIQENDLDFRPINDIQKVEGKYYF